MINSSTLLKERNLKVTQQRIAILNYLKRTDSHPNAETIFSDLQIFYPSMSFATVYKTLATFRDAKLVSEFNVGENSFRYDANMMEHPHFICDQCKKVYDLELQKSYDTLSTEITTIYNFNIDRSSIFLYGLCNTCK